MNVALRRMFVDYKEIILIIVLGLIPLTWFKAQVLIGSDSLVPFHPQIEFLRASQMWDNRLEMGRIWIGNSALLMPFLFSWTLLGTLGLSIPILQRIWLVGVFTLSAASMYYLISAMGVRSKVARMSSVVLYTFNLYVAIVSPFGDVNLLPYATAPLFLGLFIKGLETHSINYSVWVGLVSLLFASGSVNPPVYFTQWMMLLLFCVFYMIFVRKEFAFAMKYVALTVGIALSANLFWIVTYLVPLSMQTSGNLAPKMYDLDWLSWTTVNAKIVNCFRLLGSWAFNQVAFGSPYFSFASAYDNPFLTILTLAVPLVAFSALLCYPRNRKVLFFSVLAIFGLFLAKGRNEPFGNVYLWLYTNIPGFWIFREPWSKFIHMVVLSYAAMIGFTIDWVFSKTVLFKKTWIKSIFVGAVILILIGNALPLLSGEATPSTPRGGVGFFPGVQVNIPKYWIEAGDWINAQPGDWRVFLLPQNPFYQVHYMWGYYGLDVTQSLLTKPVVNVNFGGYPMSGSAEFLDILYNEIRSNPKANISNVLSVLNAKYVLLRGDLDWTQFNLTDVGSPEFFSSWLDAQRGIRLAEVFEPLKIYENTFYYQHIYAANDLLVLNGSLNELTKFLISSSSKERIAVFLDTKLSTHQKALLETLSHSSSVPSISYEKIDSTKYKVRIHNATNSFVLVFADSFDPQWIAQIGDEKIEEHMTVNGYANAWYINNTGTYDIALEFWPQKLFYIGTTISLTTFILSVSYLGKNKLRTLFSKFIRKQFARRFIH